MTTFNIHEAKTHFSKLLERVLKGEEVIIAKAGKPVARILPVVANVSKRVPGIDKGKVTIMPNFDDPLEEFAV
ncbi:MAG TPA: type II toxin-antitoxin system Phd/YefM family antitoxin [Anaerolineales bacterium]|nr:type II toxin-antitoxin system Phd/YefM family antitoxin [Anaerolineales bacterium]